MVMSVEAKANRFMGRMGFTRDERGPYVNALRALIVEKITDGKNPDIGVPFAVNASNEERARIALEREWEARYSGWTYALRKFLGVANNPYRK